MLESLWLEPIVLHFCHTQRQLHMCPWSTMVCSQPAAWTLNLSLLVASCVKAFPVGPTLHLGSTLASLNMQPTPHGFIPHSYRPPPQSLPAPNPPWLWLICPLFTHSSSASMGHHQASVVTQQQRATTSVMAVHNNQFSWGVSSILLATLQAQASMVLADVTWYQVFLLLVTFYPSLCEKCCACLLGAMTQFRCVWSLCPAGQQCQLAGPCQSQPCNMTNTDYCEQDPLFYVSGHSSYTCHCKSSEFSGWKVTAWTCLVT